MCSVYTGDGMCPFVALKATVRVIMATEDFSRSSSFCVLYVQGV